MQRVRAVDLDSRRDGVEPLLACQADWCRDMTASVREDGVERKQILSERLFCAVSHLLLTLLLFSSGVKVAPGGHPIESSQHECTVWGTINGGH